MIPSGCSPPILTLFAGRAGAADYDSDTGCLKEINELGKHHNSLLKGALRKLRAKHPHARIIYADFFGPIMEMVESPRKFGQYVDRHDCIGNWHGWRWEEGR